MLIAFSILKSNFTKSSKSLFFIWTKLDSAFFLCRNSFRIPSETGGKETLFIV